MINKDIPVEVLEQARALCALSDDPHATMYEIEAALKQANAILAPYGLTVEDISRELVVRDVVEDDFRVPGRERRTYWLQSLMTAVAHFTETKWLVSSGRYLGIRYVFVGLPTDVQRAVFHAKTLYEQIEYYGEVRAPRSVRDIRRYKQGIVGRVDRTMRELMEGRGSNPKIVLELWERIEAAPPGPLRLQSLTGAENVETVLHDDSYARHAASRALATRLARGEFYLITSQGDVIVPPVADGPYGTPARLSMAKSRLIASRINSQTRGYASHLTYPSGGNRSDYAVGYEHGADIIIQGRPSGGWRQQG